MTGEASSAGEPEGLAWQVGVWDRMSATYLREIDRRFEPVVAAVIRRAEPGPGRQVVDLGTGTGAVALRAAPLVVPGGGVLALDPSPEMRAIAARRMAAAGYGHVRVLAGRGEDIPAADGAIDVVVASLSLMYAIDRATVAGELARVLRTGGRLVAAVWAGPDDCDIVRFQQIAGRYAPPPPVPGVGPGALADPAPFLEQLAGAGIAARVEDEALGFDFESFAAAWDTLAGVTVAGLDPERRQEAQAAVQAVMWPDGERPRHFRNLTHFIVGTRQ